MKTQEEIEQLAKKQKGCSKEYCDSINEQYGYKSGYIEGYTQCQEDMANKKYTEEDIRKAIELARETESQRGALSEDWYDVEKYDEMDIIYILNKQD